MSLQKIWNNIMVNGVHLLCLIYMSKSEDNPRIFEDKLHQKIVWYYTELIPIFGFFEHNTNNRHEVESPMRWLPKFRVCWNSRRCAYRELFWKDLYEIFLTYQCVMVEHYWNKQSSIHAWVRGDWFFSTKGHWFSVWKPLYTVMNICPNWIVAWMSIPTISIISLVVNIT